MATATPLAIRGAFLATFLNKYAALPMTMTGTLSDAAAAKRVFETASFFTATTMPGALDRYGKRLSRPPPRCASCTRWCATTS